MSIKNEFLNIIKDSNKWTFAKGLPCSCWTDHHVAIYKQYCLVVFNSNPKHLMVYHSSEYVKSQFVRASQYINLDHFMDLRSLRIHLKELLK